MDDPKFINDIKARLDESYLREHRLAAPIRYDLAVSVACDIRCMYCPRQKLAELVESGFLPRRVFAPLVPYLKFSQRTALYGLGEPFLNKEFFSYLAAAQRENTPTFTSSHGMSLTDEVCRKLIEGGLEEIAISMDGCTRKVFNYLREGADFDTVRDNIRRLIRLRREAGSKTPRVDIACAVTRHNVHQMAGMVLLAKRLGADRVVFSNIIMVKPEDAAISVVGTRRFRFHWGLARRLARLLRIETLYFYQNPFPWKKQRRTLPPDGRFGCPAAWGYYVVEKDGTLKPCCYLEGSFGNVTEGNFAEAFNNEPSVSLRRRFLTGNLLDACRDCGMLIINNPEHVGRCLREVRERIARAELSAPIRAELLSLVEEYEREARQAGLGEVPPVNSSAAPPDPR